MTLGTSATTVASAAQDPLLMPAAGEIVGGWVVGNADRTAGSARLRARVGGAVQALDLAVIDASNPRAHSRSLAEGAGVPAAAGQRVGAALVTDAAWLPITAEWTAWLIVEW
jgi:hypothetical protein